MEKRSEAAVWLQFADYENNECTVHDFEVLESWIKEVLEIPLKKFMDIYVSEDAEKIYRIAEAGGKILREETSR